MASDTSVVDTLMIDNYDSFTYNLVQYLEQLGTRVTTFRNDQITVERIEALQPRRIIISPGPGAPRDAGISCDVIRTFAGRIPIFGVCLGLQCIYEVFGGVVTFAGEIVHGKTSAMLHDEKGIFLGIPTPFNAVRYHSLAGTEASLPSCLEVTCRTSTGMIQGVRHKTLVVEGVQFHPESILTEHGFAMLRNFLVWTVVAPDVAPPAEAAPASSAASFELGNRGAAMPVGSAVGVAPVATAQRVA